MYTYSVSSKEHRAPEMPLSISGEHLGWSLGYPGYSTGSAFPKTTMRGHKSCPNNSYPPIAVSAVLPRDWLPPTHSSKPSITTRIFSILFEFLLSL